MFATHLEKTRQLAQQRAHLKIQSRIIARAAEILELKFSASDIRNGQVSVSARELGRSLSLQNRLPAICSAMGRIAREIPAFKLQGKNSGTELLLEVGSAKRLLAPHRVRLPSRFQGRLPGRVRVLVLGLFDPVSEQTYDDPFGRLNSDGRHRYELYPALGRLSKVQAINEIPPTMWPPLLLREFSIGFMDLVGELELPVALLSELHASGLTGQILDQSKPHYTFDAITAWLVTPDAVGLEIIVASFGRGSALPQAFKRRLAEWVERTRQAHPRLVIEPYALPPFARPQMSTSDFADALNHKLNLRPDLAPVNARERAATEFTILLRATYITQGFINLPAKHRDLFPSDNEPFSYQITAQGHSIQGKGHANLRANPNHVARLMLTSQFSRFLIDRGVVANTPALITVTREADEVKLEIQVG